MHNDSIRFHLREQTAAVHARLDAAIGPFTSRADYGRYLPGMLAFREAAEDAVGQADYPEWFGNWRPRTIAGALRADMDDLGIAAPMETCRHHELAHAVLCPSALVGTLYVLEGSALGARFLYARAKELGLDEDFGARHLALQTQHRESWQDFVNIMERAGGLVDRDEAGKASLFAFDLAAQRLTMELTKEENEA